MLKRIIIILFIIGLFIAVKKDYLYHRPSVVRYTGPSASVEVDIDEEQKIAQNSTEVTEVRPPETDPKEKIEVVDKPLAFYLPTPKDLGILD